jgi:hypothetical protein
VGGGAARGVPLLDAISAAVLPPGNDSDFLRACLCAGPAARAAWERWSKTAGEPRSVLAQDLRGHRKRLLPLLLDNLARAGVEVDRDLAPYLRAARVREELRAETFVRIVEDLLAALRRLEIPALVIGGAALAEVAYAHRALRHAHDADLLVRPADLPRALEALAADAAGPYHVARAGTSSAELRHDSGLPVQFHTRLLRLGPMAIDDAVPYAARSLPVGEGTWQVPAPAHALAHRCEEAVLAASRGSLQWACDLYVLSGRLDENDWDVFAQTAERAHLAARAAVALDYAATALGAPVPAAVLGRLNALGEADVAGRETALFDARRGGRAPYRVLLRNARSWRARWQLLRWMLLPHPDALRIDPQPRGLWRLAAVYARRPFRYAVARWLRGR